MANLFDAYKNITMPEKIRKAIEAQMTAKTAAIRRRRVVLRTVRFAVIALILLTAVAAIVNRNAISDTLRAFFHWEYSTPSPTPPSTPDNTLTPVPSPSPTPLPSVTIEGEYAFLASEYIILDDSAPEYMLLSDEQAEEALVWMERIEGLTDTEIGVFNHSYLLWRRESAALATQPYQRQGEKPEMTPYPYGEAVRADLDGDGKDEEIVVEQFGDDEYMFKLTVNGQSTELYVINPLEKWALCDLDPNDGQKEIVISEDGPSGDPFSCFFTWRASELVDLWTNASTDDGQNIKSGLPITYPEILINDGVMTVPTRADILQTWYYLPGYRLANGLFELISEEFYPTSSSLLFVIKDFEAYRYEPDKAPVESGERITIPRGSLLLLSLTDNRRWICAETVLPGGSGSMCWILMDENQYSMLSGTDAPASEYLYGLSFAG